jgi:hypothetical protein
MTDSEWTIVKNKKKKDDDKNKIGEPCWFYNNGGCKHKDGTDKLDAECKYNHVKSLNVKRPPHLLLRKPCDKFNLEGNCKWDQECKYSHRELSNEELLYYYNTKCPPKIDPTIDPKIEPKVEPKVDPKIEQKSEQKNIGKWITTPKTTDTLLQLNNIEEHVKAMKTKYDGMSRDIQLIGQIVQKYLNEQLDNKTIPL